MRPKIKKYLSSVSICDYFHMGNIDTLAGVFDSMEEHPNIHSKSIFIFDEFQMCNTIDIKKASISDIKYTKDTLENFTIDKLVFNKLTSRNPLTMCFPRCTPDLLRVEQVY
jgi:hypothetical protein